MLGFKRCRRPERSLLWESELITTIALICSTVGRGGNFQRAVQLRVKCPFLELGELHARGLRVE